MQGNTASRLRQAFSRNSRFQTLAFLACFLFGLAAIANLQLTNEGAWMWYAVSFNHGQRLYADMHLALQPLFVLETSAFLKVLGISWLASKAAAVVHLFAYCLGLFLLTKRSNLPDTQKAVVLGCAFFVSIWTIAYQFDDYHTPADCLVLYSMLLLLDLRESATFRRTIALVSCLGLLSGLAITLRINDGLALWFGVAISIVCVAPTRRFLSVVLFIIVAAFSVVAVVHLTGDTFRTYATYSIFRAVGGKGGAGNVLLYPLKLPWNTLRYLALRMNYETTLAAFAIAAVWAYLLRPLWHRQQSKVTRQDAIAGLLILLVLGILCFGHFNPDLIAVIAAPAVLVTYVLGIAAFLRYLRWEISGRSIPWDSSEILLITPLGQVISTAASSGGFNTGVYEPFAMLIVILPLVSPIRFKTERPRALLIGLGAMLLTFGAIVRFCAPYIWHSTVAKPMFVGRQWYRHPTYGPMVIQTDTLHFIQPICDRIGPTRPDNEFLSLPFPYANYFCNIPPWHGYALTYFDTTTPEDIARLTADLQNFPPKWILYQRQLASLAAHESQYNHGQPLPHRYLDHFIEEKLSSGKWQIVYVSHYEETPRWDNQWILIRTRP